MIKTGLNALKTKLNISCAEWSKVSNVPEVTIRKILSGETDDPRLETVFRLVVSVGGSMDEILGVRKVNEIEGSAVLSLKEAYEVRIAEIKEHLNSHINTLKQDKKTFALVAAVLLVLLLAFFGADIAIGSHGWVRY